MGIRKLSLPEGSWEPGESLSQDGGEYMHITISYDITGLRSKIDSHVRNAIESNLYLQKVECVNTTIYWQAYFGERNDTIDKLLSKVEEELKGKLEEIFVNKEDLSYEKVTAFCMVGNLRAFAFEIDA
jgi:undecaprenyl pyrophosphate synthase